MRNILQSKKKLVITLGCMALGALFGYIETLIPALFVRVPFATLHIAILFALFATVCYSPAEGGLAWGVRCLVYGLVSNSSYLLIFDLVAGVAALLAVWLLLRTAQWGVLLLAPAMAVVYTLVYCSLFCIALGNGAIFALYGPFVAFACVNFGILGAIVYFALKYIPVRFLMDETL